MTEGPMAALDAIEQATGEREANVIGYCLGGTLLACLLAWLAAKDEHRIKSATFFTAMIDFTDPGRAGHIRRTRPRSPTSRRKCRSAAISKARRWPAPSTCCAPTT